MLKLVHTAERQFNGIAPREAGQAWAGLVEMASPALQPKEQPAVAATGEFWDVGDIRFFRSTAPNVLLFAPTRLALLRAGGGRAHASVTQFRQPQAGGWRSVAGSALLVLSAAVKPDFQFGRSFGEGWRTGLAKQGYTANTPPVFLPLRRRRQRVQLLVERESGAGHVLGGEMDGDAVSLVVELTGRGADEWSRALREKAGIDGRVRWTYEYPQLLHETEANYSFDGARFFTNPRLRNGDVSLKVVLKATTWVAASMEVDLSVLLAALDESYLSVVTMDAGAPFPVIVGAPQSVDRD